VTSRRSLPVPEGLDGLRLDAAISRLFGLSRTAAADLVSAGAASLDGVVSAKSERVTAGAVLDVDLPEPERSPLPPAQVVEGLRVVHEDDDLLVVDKPVGVAAHPSPGWTGPTVIGGLAAAGHRVSTSGAEERQGIVHRLDVGTTGLMVVAKSERAYTVLKDAFRERTVDKRYHTLVQGHPDPLVGTVDAPIDRHPTSAYKFAVVAGGKDSVTHYEVLEAFRHASLLEVHLETGRTHQIRVHMAALKHPCVGDVTYGADPTLSARLGLERQWLHAVRLSFAHPDDGRWVSFESPYAPDLQRALDRVREPTWV
jgi:23S rRNA pseudouridine1911/1915/1917 synthase